MFRSPVHVRDAVPDDASALVEVWRSVGERAEKPTDKPTDKPSGKPVAAAVEQSDLSAPPEPLLAVGSEAGPALVTPCPALREAVASTARIAADPDQRLLVAVVEERIVGAAHLKRAPLSPIHVEHAVYVLHLQVVDAHRRHGVGRALLEATVTWAEEKDTSHVIAAAAVASRDANRFMARLGLGQIAVVRGATVPALRAKLPVEPPAAARVGSRSHRNVGQVLVQRRSLRRARTRTS